MLKTKSIKNFRLLVETIIKNFSVFSTFEKLEAVKRQELFILVESKINKYEKGISSLQYQYNPIVESETILFGGTNYLDRQNKQFPIIKQCLKTIQDEFGINEKESYNYLNRFVEHIVLKEDIKEIDETRIAELCITFSNDLKNISPDWHIKLWTSSIWLEKDNISVNKDFQIRRPIDTDYTYKKKVINPSFFGEGERPMCGVILEITILSKDQGEIEEYLKKLVRTFRLFKLGSIEFVHREFKTNSLFVRTEYIGFFERYQNTKAKIFKYEITEELSKKFDSFQKIVVDFLPNSNWPNEDINEKTPVYIAIDRYMDAITAIQGIESLITNVITSLEALLLKSNERSELSHKLSQRVSKLLTLFNVPAVKVYSKLKRAYDIRSTFIHGSILNQEERKDLTNLHKEISEYSRLCIIVFIGRIEKSNKDEFIKRIDNALLDKNANKKLFDELGSLEIVQSTPYSE